jgi:hypothetical protein
MKTTIKTVVLLADAVFNSSAQYDNQNSEGDIDR